MIPAPGAVFETAYAKINLALHVRERMADGYHRIETLFAFAEDGDVLACEPAGELTLTVEGPFAGGLSAGEDNLVLQAANALGKEARIKTGARLTLTKNLPVASGIGGGSADAAAALRGLARLWDIEGVDLAAIGASLGADVPACLLSRSCFGSGRGDALQPLDAPALSGCPVMLVNPRIPIATAAVFERWNGTDRGALALADPVEIDPFWRNDLAAPAVELEPAIADMLDRLGALPGVRYSGMSGSGATCFALFAESAACDKAAAILADEHPGWWTLPSRLR